VDWHKSETPHLGESTLKALLQGQSTTPDIGAHFATCRCCQDRLRELAPAKADALLRSLAPLLRRLENKPEKTLRALLHQRASEVTAAKLVLDEFLERGDPVGAVDTTGISIHGLATALLDRALRLRQYSPETLYELCAVATGRLTATSAPIPGMADFDLLMLLEAETGNALRILGRTSEAQGWIVRALNRARSSPDAHSRARTRSLGSRLYGDIACFEEAELLAHAALRDFRAVGRQQEIEESEYGVARLLYLRGNFDKAMEYLMSLRAREFVGPITELSVVHLIARLHALKGEYFEGGGLLSRLRDLSQPWWDCPGIQMNCYWVRGMIIGRTIAPARGEELLRQVRSYYFDRDTLIEAAMVSTDLAELQLHRGKDRLAASTALEAVRIFEAEPTEDPHAYRALEFYQRAIARAPRNGPLPGVGRLPGPDAT
jgi:tetratricopeptide (TPR) repeat protein